MASLTYESKTRRGWRLRCYDAVDCRRRHSLWLGELPAREAERIQRHVEAIIDAQRMGLPLRPESERWLRDCSPTLRRKLSPLFSARAWTVSEALERHIDQAASDRALAANTLRGRRSVLRQLSRDRLGTLLLTAAGAPDFDGFLDRLNVSGAARGNYAGHLRAFLRWCRSENLCGRIELGTPGAPEVAKKPYLDSALLQRMIDAFADCPQTQCAVALIRWCGLRVPSEIVELPRSACDWEQSRLHFIDHKRTRAVSRGPPRVRECPMFPEVVPYLQRIWDVDAPAHAPLLPALVGVSGAAFSQRVRRRLSDAVCQPWPELFRAIRATRETELIARFGTSVACKWIGNSPSVAERNYHLISDQTWQEASGCLILTTNQTTQ